MSKELKPVAWNVTDNETGEQILYHNIYRDDVAGFTAEPLYAIPEGYALVPVELISDVASENMNRSINLRHSVMAQFEAILHDATFPPGSVVKEKV